MTLWRAGPAITASHAWPISGSPDGQRCRAPIPPRGAAIPEKIHPGFQAGVAWPPAAGARRGQRLRSRRCHPSITKAHTEIAPHLKRLLLQARLAVEPFGTPDVGCLSGVTDTADEGSNGPGDGVAALAAPAPVWPTRAGAQQSAG